jgi:aldehyde dehydrogenase (NAD+)
MTMPVSDFDPQCIRPRGGHFIAGQWDASGEEFEVTRPSDNRIYGACADAGEAGVDRAVSAAQAALTVSGWGTRPPRDRARVLRRWADLVESEAVALGQLEAIGSTRPISGAIGWDLPYTAECLRFFAEFADKHGGDVAATQSDHLGLILAEPIGVVGAIAPWNFPLVMAAWKAGPALAAGNAVVLKPSELTPYSALRLAELAVQAGLPAGIFNVVNGRGATTGDAISRHPGIGKVTFTGSTQTGARIMAACAISGPKPVTLELGGKSPQLVFDDIKDPAQVAQTIARAILGNAGQVCNAGSRLLAHRGIATELIERITLEARKISSGPTWRAATDYPPIVSQQQASRIASLVDATVGCGARVHIGAKFMGPVGDGAYYEPTLLLDVRNDMPAVREEVFGPVLTVQTFADEEEAYAMANNSIYGLTAGVFTRDLNRALRAVRAIQAGTVWVNRYGRSNDFIIPTGGYKRSGIGKDLGREAYLANLRYKSALIDFSQP